MGLSRISWRTKLKWHYHISSSNQENRREKRWNKRSNVGFNFYCFLQANTSFSMKFNGNEKWQSNSRVSRERCACAKKGLCGPVLADHSQIHILSPFFFFVHSKFDFHFFSFFFFSFSFITNHWMSIQLFQFLHHIEWLQPK